MSERVDDIKVNDVSCVSRVWKFGIEDAVG